MDIKSLFNPGQALDSKSVDFLTTAMTNNGFEGFDFLKFKQSVDSLLKMDMDQSTAVKSAFATAATLGVTKEKLIQSAMHYKQVLFKEKEQFDVALKKQMTQRVSSKQDETIYLQEKIKEYQDKINELKKQIDSFQHKIDNADAEIEAAKEKIESTKDKFEFAYENIVKQIDGDLETLKLVL